MVDKIRDFQPYGQALFDKVKKRNGDRALLSFSAGKDALAAALALREHYEEVVPFYMYLVPGLSFVEESLGYYERKLFKRPVLRVPHPSFLRWTKTHLFTDPVKAASVDELEIPQLSFTDLEVMVRQEEDLDPDCLVATGVRAEDGPIRMMAIRKYGPITLSKKKWHPNWDCSKREVVDVIAKEGLKLSAEYQWMKRSFDGIHVGYLGPIKKNAPQDYQRILDWFPLVEAEVWRHERAGLVS